MRRFLLAVVVLLGAAVAVPPVLFALLPRKEPQLPPAGRRVAVAPGVSVNVLEKGQGSPVVLVHGLPGSGYDWAPLEDALAERGFRVLAYDRVGYGRSDGRPDDDYTLAANGRELLRLLEAEGLEDATVVGWSYGGGTVMTAALEDASRMGRLVLVGSVGRWDDEPEPPPLLRALFSPPALAWVESVPPVADGVRRAISEQVFSGQPMPDWWLPQLAANMAAPHTRQSFAAEAQRSHSDGPDPAPIDRPILVIHGDDDRSVPLLVGEWLAERARDSELFVVEGGSHMLPITHAALLADRIAAFAAGGP